MYILLSKVCFKPPNSLAPLPLTAIYVILSLKAVNFHLFLLTFHCYFLLDSTINCLFV